ncbi:MAG: signal peptidase II [Candidatus Promineifilaceae bacterium]
MTTDNSLQKDYTAPPKRNDYLIFFVLAIPILIADQLSKFWVEGSLPVGIKIYVWEPYLAWSHVHNTGGTFGTFQGQTWIFALLALVVTGGLIAFNFYHPFRSRKLRIALGMVFGGALGNLIDRFRIGHVTDFIDIDVSSIVPAWVPHNIADWYIFNIADIFIIGAIIFMLCLIVFEGEEIEPSAEQLQRQAEANRSGSGPWLHYSRSAEIKSTAFIASALAIMTTMALWAGYFVFSSTFGTLDAQQLGNQSIGFVTPSSAIYLLGGMLIVGAIAFVAYQRLAIGKEKTPDQAFMLVDEGPQSAPLPQVPTLPAPVRSAETERKILLTGATIVALILLVWQSMKTSKR